ncbi:MAG TPA: hypothetical protein VHZ99_06900 [Steroidobacteraceae bacterium]|nr:hypothetical protein [Steroidobacteraceae bacterium]
MALGLVVSMPAFGQEVSLLAGALQTQEHSSYDWQIEYHQQLGRSVAASLGWINEGHVIGHRRDGVTTQLWMQRPWATRWRFGVAVGPYFYFDTEPNDRERGYGDHHGLGVAATGGVRYQAWGPLDLQLRITGLWAQGDINTQSIEFGVGYTFAHLLERTRPATDDGRFIDWSDGRQSISAFGGVSTLNSLAIRNWSTYGLDYQYRFNSWVAIGGAALIDAGTHSPHDRLAIQTRISHRVENSPLTLTAGVGASVTLIESGAPSQEPVEGLLLLRAGWNLSSHLSVEASWYRTFTQDDHDLDIIVGGLDWRF